MKIHLYQPLNHHGDAYLVADKEALKKLRDKIDEALKHDEPQSFVGFAQDGEGFTTFVIPVDQADNKWDQMLTTYKDPFYKSCGIDDDEVGLHPFNLLEGEQYKSLHRQASKDEEESYQKSIT